MFNEALITVIDISAGAWHTCALTGNFLFLNLIVKFLDEGDVYGWGWNSCGQLGYSSEEVKNLFNLNSNFFLVYCPTFSASV